MGKGRNICTYLRENQHFFGNIQFCWFVNIWKQKLFKSSKEKLFVPTFILWTNFCYPLKPKSPFLEALSILVYFFQPPKHSSDWRPAVGYENVDVTPLPAHPTTNQLVQPCFVSSGMSTEPLNFPNLVTGFEVCERRRKLNEIPENEYFREILNMQVEQRYTHASPQANGLSIALQRTTIRIQIGIMPKDWDQKPSVRCEKLTRKLRKGREMPGGD